MKDKLILRIRGFWKVPDGRDCLWGNLGLALTGRDRFSISLIQFSVDGWGYVSSLVGVMVVMMASFKRTYASMPQFPGLLHLIPLTPWQGTVDPSLRQRLLDTHRQVWLSLLWGHAAFSWFLVGTRFCLFPPRVCFPSPVEAL